MKIVYFLKSTSVCLLISILLMHCKHTTETTEAVRPVPPFQVDVNYAKQVATIFRGQSDNPNARQDMSVLGDSSLIESTKTYLDATLPVFHVINYKNNKGWTIISGDRRMTPVLAYSNSGNFNLVNFGKGTSLWIEGISSLMKNARSKLTTPNEEIENRWKYYEKKAGITVPGGRVAESNCSSYDQYMHQCPQGTIYANQGYPNSLAGSFADTWLQSLSYAYSCPSQTSFGGICANCNNNSLTGCGPLATAMVMRANFHNKGTRKPSSGYDWDLMDDSRNTCQYITSGNIELSRLIRFNYNALGASQATGNCDVSVSNSSIPNAFAAAGYSNSGSVVDFNANQSAVRTDLNQGYPVVLSGFKNGTSFTGHIWVADGFHLDTNYNLDCSGSSPICQESAFLFYHLNWGEGDQAGSNNGWYGVGGFVMNGDTYNTNLKATVGVRP